MRLSPEERAALYVARMDGAKSGAGGHNATFAVASVLVWGFGLEEDAALRIMSDYNRRCEPPWSEAELRYKLSSAARCGGRDGKPRGHLLGEDVSAPSAPGADYGAAAVAKPKEVAYDPSELRRLAGEWRDRVSVVWLGERSPVDVAGLSPEGYLEALYGEGEKVVVFTDPMSQGQAVWPDEPIPHKGLKGVWYLAQPVDGQYYPNPRSVDREGHPKSSRRSMESVVAWRYMLLESDEADMRDWLGLLVQMPLRISAIYSSGGRSVHALVRVDAATKQRWDAIKAELEPTINLLSVAGVDRRALTAIRLTRLPNCWRNKQRQKLFYLNPCPAVRPIIDMPTVRDVVKQWLPVADEVWRTACHYRIAELLPALEHYAPGSSELRGALAKIKES